MNKSDIYATIKSIAIESFKLIDKVFECNKEQENEYFAFDTNHLVFPKYSSKGKAKHNGIRISEQELRFLFVDVMKYHPNGKNFYYSIETPTIDKYIFSDKNNNNNKLPRVATEKEKGRSGNFDLVLFDKAGNRVAYIEFKAKGSQKEYEKDILKLVNECNGIPCFIIDLWGSSNRNTLERYSKKLCDSFSNVKKKTGKSDIDVCYIAHVIQKSEELNIIVFKKNGLEVIN